MTTATAERTSAPAGTETFDGWVGIPPACKPSKVAAAPNDLRPVLQHGHVRHTEDGSFLYVTNSYVLVEIPITFHGGDLAPEPSLEARQAALPEIAIPFAALKALDASKGRFRLFDGLIEIEGRADLYRLGKDGMQAPNFAEMMAENTEAKKGAVEAFGFNGHFLSNVSEALGANHGVRLDFISPLRAATVTSLSSGGGRGLLMPVRLSV